MKALKNCVLAGVAIAGFLVFQPATSAQTGATVMSGSVVSTGSGSAVVDLGPAGRVEVRDHTTATIICVGGSFQVRTSCNKTKVEVNSGQANVTSPKVETVAAGKSETFDGGVDLTAPPGSNIEV